MTQQRVNIEGSKFFRILAGVGKVADSLEYKCYVVGGFVRDLLLHKDNDDIDFVVEGSGLKMAEAVAKFYNTDKVSLYESYGTAKVDVHGIELEFVGARKEFYHRESRNPIVEDGTIQDDMDRRDLTINDMAICLNTSHFGELIDPHDGYTDLQAGIIKTPLDPNITFSDDPLRMLRAIRFANRFNYTFDNRTWDAIVNNVERIRIITPERIIAEIEKMMKSDTPAQAIRMLKTSGLLKIIIPEIDSLDYVHVHNGIRHKNIFEHTMQVLDNVSKQTDNVWVRWAALFHDVAKPKTQVWSDELNQWTFYYHAEKGAKMIPAIFKRLELPLDNRMELVKKLIDMHMRPHNLCEEGVSDSAVRRILFDAGDDIDYLLMLCKSDITTASQAKLNHYLTNYALLVERMHEIEESDHLRNFQPPVDGNEIMEMFNLTPCRTVGILKNAVKDAILDGIIPNEREAAIEFVKEKFKTL